MTAGEQPPPSRPADDDPRITDTEALCRRLSDSSPNMLVRDEVSGERRPSSAAFKPDADGISVYRLDVLTGSGLGPADLCTRDAQLVVTVQTADVRSQGLGVRPDPWPLDVDDPGHPRHAAHALIIGFATLSRGERRRRQQSLTRCTSLRFVHGLLSD